MTEETESTVVYQRTQWGWLGFPILAVVFVIMLIVFLFAEDATALLLWTLGFMVVLFLIVLHFSRLTVTVDDSSVTVGFGLINRPHRRIGFDEVKSVAKVRNSWWYGYGVRWIPGGTMYNVQGNDAVELTYLTDKKFRIGTDDVENLYAVLASVIPVD